MKSISDQKSLQGMHSEQNENAVLRYTERKRSQGTVLRHYLRWRQTRNPPMAIDRCDNSNCYFHTNPLIWNGKPFKLILDHRNGVNSDNRPESLRLLCPICDSQLDTRGGANAGKVEKSKTGFAIVNGEDRYYTILDLQSGIAVGRINEFDISGFTFDNNVLVAGGEAHIHCQEAGRLHRLPDS